LLAARRSTIDRYYCGGRSRRYVLEDSAHESALAMTSLLIPDAPVQAYAADLDRLGRSEFGTGDIGWLALGHLLWRSAELPEDARVTFLHEGAPALETFGTQPAVRRAADAIRGVTTARNGAERAARADDVAAAVRAIVADEERAGAFTLALATLAALRSGVPSMTARAEGLVLAQQGRAARQLGDLPGATAFYDAAAALGRRAGATDVRVHALLGRGVVANMRGNYPEARRTFGRALALARGAGETEFVRAAHHGLLHAAIAASDIETALIHGWEAAQGAAEAPDQRAEILNNLGEVCRVAGYEHAALRGHLAAIALTELARIRLAALGGAALAAGRLGAIDLLALLARDAERAIDGSGQPYENALTLVEFGEAYAAVGDRAASVRFGARAAVLAAGGGFHEVAYRARLLSAGTESPHPSMTAVGAPSSPRSRAIVRAIEALPAPAELLAAAGQYQG
jgi:tetratricopeptide (TPR) repeat protein